MGQLPVGRPAAALLPLSGQFLRQLPDTAAGTDDTLRAPFLHRSTCCRMADSLSSGERELAELIVTALNLEGVAPDDIDPEAPLFKTGLALDSIDALELALEISKRYGFQLRSDDENNVRIFSSLRSLAQHIAQNRVS